VAFFFKGRTILSNPGHNGRGMAFRASHSVLLVVGQRPLPLLLSLVDGAKDKILLQHLDRPTRVHESELLDFFLIIQMRIFLFFLHPARQQQTPSSRSAKKGIARIRVEGGRNERR
jgi:hypothetical protein